MADTDAPDNRQDVKKQPKDGPPLAKKTARPDEPPAAGPHATKDLSNPDATPSAGTLQAPDAKNDMDSTG